jgi:Ala-tRNA(Pro) deacylase
MLNTQPGSLSITSLIFDKDKKIMLAVDKEVFEAEFVCCHPCDNTATLKIRTDDIINKLLPELKIKPEIIEI